MNLFKCGRCKNLVKTLYSWYESYVCADCMGHLGSGGINHIESEYEAEADCVHWSDWANYAYRPPNYYYVDDDEYGNYCAAIVPRKTQVEIEELVCDNLSSNAKVVPLKSKHKWTVEILEEG